MKPEPLKDKQLVYRNLTLQKSSTIPKSWKTNKLFSLNFEKIKNSFYSEEDIKSAVEWLREYLGNPIYYFGRFPKQRKSFWKYVGVNPDTMIEGELINYISNFNKWLVYKAFPDTIQKNNHVKGGK